MNTCLKCGHMFCGNVCDECGWEYKSVSELKAAANAGDAESQALLGQIYYHGNGVTADLQESIKWHRLAAKNGNADSQFDLGLMYA